MSDATFITTIVSMCVAFLGAMGVIAQVLGARIGDLRGDAVNARPDAQSSRIARIEDRLDGIAQTVAEHERRLK